MRKTYRVQYIRKGENVAHYYNTPGNIAWSHFATYEGARHLLNQVLWELPNAPKNNTINIVTEYVEDDYKWVKEKY